MRWWHACYVPLGLQVDRDGMAMKQVLVVSGADSHFQPPLNLSGENYAVTRAHDAHSALKILADSPQDLVIVDLETDPNLRLELIKQIGLEHPETSVFVVTPPAMVEAAAEAMKLGAFGLLKPANAEVLRILIDRSLDYARLRQENYTLRATLDDKYAFKNIIGRSPALLYVVDAAARAAQTDATILIRGEPGTGKELLAKSIHLNSSRHQGPFVKIHCAAMPREVVDSGLFGPPGSSGIGCPCAKSRIELADRGTAFLDEIGEISLESQAKLLKLIQERELEIDARPPVKVDVRIIAATRRNLQAMVEDGTFREDLYYRLNIIPLELPPLRERANDIPELVGHFFAAARQKYGRSDISLPGSLMANFCAYRWPGNIRELENVIERIVVLCGAIEVSIEDLPDFLRHQRSLADPGHLDLPPGGISLVAAERELILRALEKFDWNQTQAARYLDLSRKTLIYRMEKFGLHRETAAERAVTNTERRNTSAGPSALRNRNAIGGGKSARARRAKQKHPK